MIVMTANDAPCRAQSVVDSGFVESAKQDRTEVNGPLSAIGRHDAEALMSKRAADEDSSTIPEETSISMQLNVVTERRWFRALEPTWIMT